MQQKNKNINGLSGPVINQEKYAWYKLNDTNQVNFS